MRVCAMANHVDGLSDAAIAAIPMRRWEAAGANAAHCNKRRVYEEVCRRRRVRPASCAVPVAADALRAADPLALPFVHPAQYACVGLVDLPALRRAVLSNRSAFRRLLRESQPPFHTLIALAAPRVARTLRSAAYPVLDQHNLFLQPLATQRRYLRLFLILSRRLPADLVHRVLFEFHRARNVLFF